jgi:ADP-heptose:LPS heptosyltransferase
VRWFSLRVGERALDRVARDAPPPCPITYLAPDLTDFGETAAALAALDLLICVDTSVAHLAGAMGAPAWLLLPRVPDWRWPRAGAASPWYPTLRLFRQDDRRAWPPVVEEVADALRGWARV